MVQGASTQLSVPTLDPRVSPRKTSAPVAVSGPGIKDVIFTSAGQDDVSKAPVMLSDKVIGVMYCCFVQLEHAQSSEMEVLAPDRTRCEVSLSLKLIFH